ncbi:hypothetical protein Hanom_Chr04g00368251 [Helianthus anomalus]
MTGLKTDARMSMVTQALPASPIPYRKYFVSLYYGVEEEAGLSTYKTQGLEPRDNLRLS